MFEKSFLRRLLCGTLAVAMLGGFSVSLNPAKSAALVNDGWAIPMDSGLSDAVFTDPYGQVHLSNCSNLSVIVDDSGTEVAELPHQESGHDISYGCANFMSWVSDTFSTTVNDDGRIVSVSGPSYVASSIRVSLADGTLDESYPVFDECDNPGVISSRPVVDDDLAIYILRSCYASGWRYEYNLQGMDITTGDITFTTSLGQIDNTDTPVWIEGGIALNAYSSVRFFDGSGVEDVSATAWINVGSRVLIHPNGDALYVSMDDEDPMGCYVNFDPIVGSTVTHSVDCGVYNGWISQPIPDGVVMVSNLQDDDPLLTIINKGGPTTVVHLSSFVPQYANDDSYSVTQLQVDSDGQIVIGAYFEQDVLVDNTMTPVGRVLVDSFDVTGNFQGRWNSASLGWTDSFSIGAGGLALADGYVYVGSNHQMELVQLPVPGMRLPYRDALRWDIEGVSSATPKKYVALGDSFSAGEGLSPYLAGTDTATNKCHRSDRAYPSLLAQSLGLNVELEAFVACAGGVLWHLDHENDYSDDPQLDAITADTDIVSITMGGNDVGIVEFATSCVLLFCEIGSIPYNDTLDRINAVDFSTKLEDAYASILDEMKPGSKLYVLSYPHVAPVKTALDPPSLQCLYMQAGSSLWANARGAYDITARLNAKIEQAVFDVSLTDDRIRFVDTSPLYGLFDGHDVCSEDAYVFDANLSLQYKRSLHPNSKGHEVIAQYVKSSL